jgi:NitT/TauT family transport system substrate-binding protein
MGRWMRAALVALAAFAAITGAANQSAAATKSSFRVAWSVYVGWMPWAYAAESGIMKRWADKYGIEIELVEVDSYIGSIDQYTTGRFDGCAMTNMDALSIPAASAVDSTSLIIGDYSNGNDGIVLRNGDGLADIKGRRVNLVELSVSHYLLVRALEGVNLTERDVTLVNTADADIVSSFTASSDTGAVVTWNPLLAEVLRAPGASLVFDSSKMPGEIVDLMVVNTETLRDNPAFGKALVGAWYEVMSLMQRRDAVGETALADMARAARIDIETFRAQLEATSMFYEPKTAAAFNSDLLGTMDLVRTFALKHGLLGQGVSSDDVVGMEFPDGTVLGNPENVKLRFDAAYMSLAADGKL